jgi:hypothetical protein
MGQFRTSRVFDAIFLIAMAGLIWWAAVNRVQIGDWLFFLHYQPSPAVTAISQDAGLSAAGQKLLYRGDPQFDDKATVTQVCGDGDIGCLTPTGQIIVLDEQNRHDRSVVTSAHEMLHLAYRRLSGRQKDDLKPLLDQAIQMNAGTNINAELTGAGDTDDRYDEAHSVLGSEYKRLPPDLEKYYRRYFSDRSKDTTAQARDESIRN